MPSIAWYVDKKKGPTDSRYFWEEAYKAEKKKMDEISGRRLPDAYRHEHKYFTDVDFDG